MASTAAAVFIVLACLVGLIVSFAGLASLCDAWLVPHLLGEGNVSMVDQALTDQAEFVFNRSRFGHHLTIIRGDLCVHKWLVAGGG